MPVDIAGADRSTADESCSAGWKLLIFMISAPAMSTDMSQVGVATFPSFYITKFYKRERLTQVTDETYSIKNYIENIWFDFKGRMLIGYMYFHFMIVILKNWNKA